MVVGIEYESQAKEWVGVDIERQVEEWIEMDIERQVGRRVGSDLSVVELGMIQRVMAGVMSL